MTLDELIWATRQHYDSLSPLERDKLDRQQRESWLRAELSFGNDAQEARWREYYIGFVDPCDIAEPPSYS